MTTPANPDDLIAWLRAQLDDDERIAKRVEPNQAPNDLRAMVTRDGSPPFLVIDSARVLRRVAADRRVLELHSSPDPSCDECGYLTPCATVRLLAIPYADRPGYRSEWAPDDLG